ncbi:MAG TPA: hypothetical protein VHA70_07415 [Bauldia sp.]|nr:hypothetical protein [Bauldia sp.]
MSNATFPRTGLVVGGGLLVALGIALWAKFGALVYFDTIAASFIGCFF